MGSLPNCEYQNETQHNAAFHQGLHCALQQIKYIIQNPTKMRESLNNESTLLFELFLFVLVHLSHKPQGEIL